MRIFMKALILLSGLLLASSNAFGKLCTCTATCANEDVWAQQYNFMVPDDEECVPDTLAANQCRDNCVVLSSSTADACTCNQVGGSGGSSSPENN